MNSYNSVDQLDKDGNTLLHLACYDGRLETVKLLLYGGANIFAVGQYGYTPLYYAVKKKNVDIAKVLVEFAGSDDIVNVFDNNDRTPLYWACANGHIEMVNFLLEKGAKIFTERERENPLHLVVELGDFHLVTVLIESGIVDVNIINQCYDTPLHVACLKGHLKIVQFLLRKGADVNMKGNFGHTPLHRAIKIGYFDIFQELLAIKNIDINIVNDHGDTPLHTACMEDNEKMVRILLKKGATFFIFRKFTTPLHWAAEQGDVAIMQRLLEVGNIDDVDVLNEFEETPLILACEHDHLEMVKFLLKRGAKLSIQGDAGYTPLYWAVFNYNLELTQELFASGTVDVNIQNTENDTLLHLACKQESLEIVEWLLNKGADVSIIGRLDRLPLHWAVEKKNFKIVEALLKVAELKNVNMNILDADQYTPFHLACSYNENDRVIDLLLEKGVIFFMAIEKEFNPLHWAASNGNLKMMKILLESSELGNVDINCLNNYDNTPLNLACQKNHLDVVKYLIQRGANVLTVGVFGFIPLHWAAENGSVQIAQELFIAAAAVIDINTKDKKGATPLHVACEYNRLEMVKWLLKRGADPTIIDELNGTPLHWAARDGNLKIVQTLFTLSSISNVGINILNREGDTALHLACKYAQFKIVQFLLKKDPDVFIQNQFGYTPLHCAVLVNHFDIVKKLVQYDCNLVSTQSKNEDTPLHLAMMEGNFHITDYLIKNGANQKAFNSFKETPWDLLYD